MKDIFKNIFRRAQNFEGFIEYSYVSYNAHWYILATGNNNKELMFVGQDHGKGLFGPSQSVSLLPPHTTPLLIGLVVVC